jgi:ABC-type antimicrobial peptide transport system permease subunit
MFFLAYMWSELRRRRGRTLLTILGLGLGVGLVVAVTALSDGLDRAQDEVLRPLTGVGADLAVSRPVNPEGAGSGLSDEERRRLRAENDEAHVDLAKAGDPGERFRQTSFIATTQLSFSERRVKEIAELGGVEDATGALTLTAITVSGTVPAGGLTGGLGAGPAGAAAAASEMMVDSRTVTGVDPSKSSLASVTSRQIRKGRYLRDDDSREAVVNVSYARRKAIAVGDEIKLRNRKYEVVGLAEAPLGGQASDIYVTLPELQSLARARGRVNAINVRATSSGAVDTVEREIDTVLEGASVTTAADLADRIGGSLSDAKDLSNSLGTALTIVALVAAFLIASLLTLNSVAKRVRELGTLKAIGWTQWLVVRQITGESMLIAILGGVVGALIGIGGAAAISAIGPTLEASVSAPSGAGGAGVFGGFGQGSIATGQTDVALEAPVDAGLLGVAIALALVGGLIAGSLGGLRAARLRPADALRSIE